MTLYIILSRKVNIKLNVKINLMFDQIAQTQQSSQEDVR